MEPLNKETIDGILDLAGGEDFILVELFESFLDDAKELSGGILNSASASDWEKLQFDVHTLKGLSATIGATPLFEVCKVMNDDLKTGNEEKAKFLAEEVVEKYKELVVYITSNYNVKYEA